MAFNLKLVALAFGTAAVISYGGLSTFGGGSDGKLEVNGVSLDAPGTDWSKIDEEQFRLRPTTEGSRPAFDVAYKEAKAAIDSDDNVVAVLTGDEKIEKAVAKARETLPRFFELMEARTPGNYLIKYKMEEDGQIEHIWVQLTGSDGDAFVGLLSNEPVLIKSRKMGEEVTVPQDRISDWMVKTDREIYGGYTMRALLDELPEDQAAALQAMLRD